MRVILFYIGSYPVRSYGLAVALSVLLAMGVAYFLARGSRYQKHIANLVFYVIIGGIVGARFWEVFFFQGEYYSQHVLEIFAIWNGGLSIQGALVGGFAAGLLYTRIHRLSFWELADMLAPAVILGQSMGRIACLLNGDAFGSPTGSNFGLVYPKGTIAYETYGPQPLWPAEVWEGQWDLVVFAVLILLRNKKWPTGFLFLSYNILYSLGRFLLEFLRGDTPRYALGWTAAQWTSFAVIVISLLLMLYFFLRKQRTEAESESTPSPNELMH